MRAEKVGEGTVPAVSIVRVGQDHIEAAVQRAVELSGGFLDCIYAGSTVLIKPNVVGPSPSGSGNVTDAGMTEAVTRVVLERDPGRVAIGEGSSVGYDFPGRVDTLHCLEANGAAEVARRLGVGVVDLNRDEPVEVRAPDAFLMETFRVARTAWEADAVVCLPVVKTHIRTGITCSLKNMKGVLPGDEKKRTHQLGLDRAIVDLNRVMEPDFTVVDAIVGMEGMNLYPEDCVPMGTVLAGADAVAVDAVCTTMTGFDVDHILHVRLVAEEGLGVADLDEIELRGVRLEDVRRRFVPHGEAARDRLPGATIVEKNACTGCMGEMVSTFIYLDKAGYSDRQKDLTLVLGTPDEVPSIRGNTVVIGKCARPHRDQGVFVPACPPHGRKIADAACRALGVDRGVMNRAVKELHDF